MSHFQNKPGYLCHTQNGIIMLLTAFSTTAIAADAKIGNTTVDISGFVKLDAMFTNYNDGTPASSAIDDFYIPSVIPTAAAGTASTGESTKFNAHAKQTRFNLKTATELENGKKINGLIEVDFGPGSPTSNGKVTTNRSGVDLRHATISYDKWTVGQTWTNALNTSSLADTLDLFTLAEGVVATRQAQVRYTNGPFSASLENPETRINTPSGRVDTNDSTLPDLTVKYTSKGDFGNVSVAGLARQLKYEDQATKVDSSTMAAGVNVAGKINVGAKDDVRFSLTQGKGLGRYVGLALNSDGYLDAGGKIKTIDQTAANIGYKHAWTPKASSTLGYAIYEADADAAAGVINKKSQSIHANLLYNPTKEVTLGGEYIHGKLEKSNGTEGDMDRLQFSVKYNF
ncbi:DcaP family trimeric outer membrane transporter [Thiothrix lacustris]|uniref:DcaP family trimeric outer membrane transporter n=1 Tax=Thiothrix lacustris TaxID=525917 RepID=A0ABY9MSY8_9GAMM|nr:DcaP family trimeric outer membrane transporter [Thiothrix lacustris]WML91767.1 DcaP family trimeric outer membrane transporter [Thiothrix lacustris]